MFSNYLSSIENVAVFPMISLIIFILLFAAVTFFVMRTDKSFSDRMSNLPLENEKTTKNISETNDE